MEEVVNIGKYFERSEYDDYFVRFKRVNKAKVDEKIFRVIDGKEVDSDFNVEVVSKNHRVKFSSFLSLEEVFSARVNLEEVFKRADEHNRTVVGYIGKNIKYEKIYLIKCNICGYVAEQFMRKFFKCNGCNPTDTKTQEQFEVDAKGVHKNRYDYSSVVYKNSTTKVDILCLKCGKYFSQTPQNHLSGRGCSRCKQSKGELKMIDYFESRGIRYELQKTYDDLIDVQHLRYDFYLPDYNILMEYDGIGHYKARFGSTPEIKLKNLLDTQKKDKIKDKYAADHNISLFRMPYWHFKNIFEILDNYFANIIKEEKVVQLALDL